jgi:hypothetical protein
LACVATSFVNIATMLTSESRSQHVQVFAEIRTNEVQDRGRLRRRAQRNAVEARFVFRAELTCSFRDVQRNRSRSPMQLIRKMTATRKKREDPPRAAFELHGGAIDIEPVVRKVPFAGSCHVRVPDSFSR